MSILFTDKEQKMIDGELGEGVQKSMEILVAIGKIYNAEKFIPVTSSQISGVSYKTIGDAGIEYLEEMVSKNTKVSIPSFLNPSGMDREQWKKMGVPESFSKKQIKIMDLYSKLGVSKTYTCTPYFVGIRPKIREHIAWAESSAVSFANSVLGARTNREGGPSALASAVCGITPYYELHIDKNRIATIIIRVEAHLKDSSDFGAMGYFLGQRVKGKIPAFVGIKSASEDNMKSLGAAMAATGSVALYYIDGITPEFVVSNPENIKDMKEIIFTDTELNKIKNEINKRFKSNDDSKPELIAIGCPHASLDEIKKVAELVDGKKVCCDLWVCTSRFMREKADEKGYLKTIEKAGGKIIADTCMVVCPIEEMGYKITAVNSGKAAKYLPSFNNQTILFERLKKLLKN